MKTLWGHILIGRARWNELRANFYQHRADVLKERAEKLFSQFNGSAE